MGGLNIKYLSLITLVFQNSLLVLIMRYSRTLPGPPFRASVAVAASEIIKFSISLLIYIRDLRKTKQITPSLIAQEIFGVNSGWLKMTVPAILYLVQNNLQYIAVTLLDAATFQVTYQMKIITTAMFSVLLLNRQLSRQKWVALCILTAGIAIVQLSNLGVASAKSLSGDVKQQFLGLLAVGAACTLSGLAGVWFERELKGSSTSLFLRNVQLSLFSVIPALIGILIFSGVDVYKNGFFYGFTLWTWGAILCQAFGGLIVAVVVKYADNILKGFATSISIILSAIASIFIFDFQITPSFFLGSVLVLYGIYFLIISHYVIRKIR